MSFSTEPDLFEALFESSHVHVALLDCELRFLRVNHAYADAVARTPASMVGLAHFDLYPHAENEALFRRVLETGEPYRVDAKPFKHPDQPHRPITYWDWTLSAIDDRAGERLGVLLQLVDVTDRVNVEKLADERQLLLREIHHRVKNNLQVVAAFLREISYTHPEVGTTVDRALGRVGAIARIHDTLTLSRDFASVDLVSYASAIAGEIDRLHGRANVRVNVTGSAVAPVDIASPVGMILQELISNALEHAFEENARGTIDVHVETADGYYVIEVCDDGAGLRGRKPESEGLELVFGLSDQLGGSFEAHALTPRGTCCHLRVPIPRA